MASKPIYRLRASMSTDSPGQWKYDVFMNFRGETRMKFTDHLYHELQRQGIGTFRDEPDLETGQAIPLQLLSAIEQSRFAVVVLSPNYASSTWCLRELVKIVACMEERRTILPVFYEVDPSDVRSQKGSFAEAFAYHENRSGGDSREVQEWRDVLKKVANISGNDSKEYRYETDLIKDIVDAVWKKVHSTIAPRSAPKEKLVGIDSKLMEIQPLLNVKATDHDHCFIGIWGMGGIGKTTLATQVFQIISHHFEVSIFLSDVRQVSTAKGLVHLQKRILFQILKKKNEVQNVDDGVTRLNRCLKNKKVLLVLDDVDRLDQLENLAGKEWFGSGSIVIVTTRNNRLLDSHGIKIQYKSKGLNETEALEYFSWQAFEKNKPEEGFMELSKSILEYARGLPLALKILGSDLLGRARGIWESTVADLKKAPIDHDIFKVLRISYDGLDEICKQVFLDTVCFLKGNDKERVIQILTSVFGFGIRKSVDVLIEKSLLTEYDNCLDMHDLIQEMGEEIVRLDSENWPGRCRRLWLRDDIFRLLTENVETQRIRSMVLCLPKVKTLCWNPKAFHLVSELKFLKIQNLVLSPGPECLPNDIRVLEWTSYPSKSLPPGFHPMGLLELSLHHSKINNLWHETKYLGKLTIMDLSYSENLTTSPDFSGTPSLERLVLEGCTNLVNIHPSIVSLERLKVLNLKNCQSIDKLPAELDIDSLEMIDFSGCSKVNIFPRFVSPMKKVSELSFGGISMQISEVSYDSAGPYHPLRLVLASLRHFCSLKRLNLSDCKLGNGAIPDDIGCLSSLEELDLSVNDFVSLPASISQLSKLKCLNLDDCKRLQELPCLPSFSGTCDVTAVNCISLKKFPDPPKMCRLTAKASKSKMEDSKLEAQKMEAVVVIWKLSFNFMNCHSLEGGSCYMIHKMLQRFLQEPPSYFEMCSMVIPTGSDIPCWFNNVRSGASLRQNVTKCSSRTSKCCSPTCSKCSLPTSSKCSSPTSKCSSPIWIGFALCVLVGAEENPGVLGAKTISCSWDPGAFVPSGFSFDLKQVVKSDHLCVFLVPSVHFPEYTKPTDATFIDFFFEAGAGLKVKKCGIRILYKRLEEELKELDSKIKQHHQHDRSIGMVQEPRPVYEMFDVVIPGIDIPVWFDVRGNEYSVSQKRPCTSGCEETWMGFALCVLYGANRTHRRWNAIWVFLFGGSFRSSDRLRVFFIPRENFLQSERWINFAFEIKHEPARNDAYLEVKQYGLRCLYERDLPSNLANASLKEQLLRSIHNSRAVRGGSRFKVLRFSYLLKVLSFWRHHRSSHSSV